MGQSFKSEYNAITYPDGAHAIRPEDQERLKRVLADALFEIDSVCRESGITVFLCGGSLLGAVRHKGYIPWDDDLDVAMTRADFERFKTIFTEKLGKKYTLNCPNYSNGSLARFPKILINGTCIKSIGMTSGFFIDVFIIENCPQNKLRRALKGLTCQVLMGIASMVWSYAHREEIPMEQICHSGKSRMRYRARLFFGKIFSLSSLDHWYNRIDKRCRYRKETGLVTLPCGRKHYFGEILDAKVFAEGVLLPFEEYSFSAPVGYDAYLKNLYGDYMQIPPVEKRETHKILDIDFGTTM